MRTPRSKYSYPSSSRWRRHSIEDTFRAGHRNGSLDCCAMPTEYWVESGFLWSVRTTLLRLAKRLYSLTLKVDNAIAGMRPLLNRPGLEAMREDQRLAD